VEKEVVAFTTGAETAKMVFIVETRTELVEDREASTAFATILEEVRKHTRSFVLILLEKSCMIADLESVQARATQCMQPFQIHADCCATEIMLVVHNETEEGLQHSQK
jgi:hypothetical protein